MQSLRCALFSLCMAAIAVPASAAELSVRIDGMLGTGAIHVFVYTKADGFPKEEAAVQHVRFPVDARTPGRLDVRMTVPEAEEYALVAYQDKDGNGRMNRLLGMIPQEPYGLSQNPELFGKPKFSEASFRLKTDELIVIHLKD